MFELLVLEQQLPLHVLAFVFRSLHHADHVVQLLVLLSEHALLHADDLPVVQLSSRVEFSVGTPLVLRTLQVRIVTLLLYCCVASGDHLIVCVNQICLSLELIDLIDALLHLFPR